MPISIDWETYIIFVPKNYLTPIGGTIYELDTNNFRLDLKALEASEAGMPHPKTHIHNTEVTVAGTTFARSIEILLPYSVEFEDGQYSVILKGSNNNIFDVANGILVQNQVQIISTNSAGLITVVSGSGVTEQDKLDIADRVWDETLSEHASADSTGEALDSAASAAGATPDEIANAVWDEVQTEHTIDGTFGKYLDSPISSIKITQVSSGINASAQSFELISGVVDSGTYLDVRGADGIYHFLRDDNGVLDCNYTFNIGRDAVPTSAAFLADLYGGNDDVGVYAWNYSVSAWEQIGLREGDTNRRVTLNNYALLQAHVGYGAQVGEVKIRYYATGLTSAELRIDQLIVTYSVVTRSIGYYGQIVSGSSTQVQLGLDASSVDNYYKPGLIVIVSGTGKDQYGRIASYDGLTRTINIAGIFVTPPDSTSYIQIHPWGSVRVSEVDSGVIADDVWDEASSAHSVVGSFGEEIQTHATPEEVNTQVDQALLDYDGPTKSELDSVESTIISEISSLPSATDIDTLLSANHGSGSWEGAGGSTPEEIAEKVWENSVATQLNNLVETLYKINTGHWKIQENKLIYYDENDQILVEFNLYDENGSPTMRRVLERIPV